MQVDGDMNVIPRAPSLILAQFGTHHRQTRLLQPPREGKYESVNLQILCKTPFVFLFRKSPTKHATRSKSFAAADFSSSSFQPGT